MRISWIRSSDWLPIVFHFGTENWEEQLKTTLYVITIASTGALISKHLHDELLVARQTKVKDAEVNSCSKVVRVGYEAELPVRDNCEAMIKAVINGHEG